MSKFQFIQVASANGVKNITLNRPEKRNALSPEELIDELAQSLEDATDCDCGVVILTGAGSAFCAGLDMEHLETMTARTMEQHRRDSGKTHGARPAHPLRVSQAHHCRGQWSGHRRRHGHRHPMRLYLRRPHRRSLWLHRSPRRLRPGHCRFVPDAPGRRKRTREAAP